MKCSSERPRVSEKERTGLREVETRGNEEERERNTGWASVSGKWDAIGGVREGRTANGQKIA